jgi:hypothetical protein
MHPLKRKLPFAVSALLLVLLCIKIPAGFVRLIAIIRFDLGLRVFMDVRVQVMRRGSGLRGDSLLSLARGRSSIKWFIWTIIELFLIWP